MRRNIGVTLVVALAAVAAVGRAQQPALTTAAGEWPTYGGDLASTRYSPLDQITADNFSKLEVAWRFKTDPFGPRPDYLYQTTPLMVGGVLYATAGVRRAVVALNAGTGELLWMHAEDEGAVATRRRARGPAVAWPIGATAAIRG
jgi:quinoprotein glucose dehydrogenase